MVEVVQTAFGLHGLELSDAGADASVSAPSQSHLLQMRRKGKANPQPSGREQTGRNDPVIFRDFLRLINATKNAFEKMAFGVALWPPFAPQVTTAAVLQNRLNSFSFRLLRSLILSCLSSSRAASAKIACLRGNTAFAMTSCCLFTNLSPSA